MSGIFIFVSNLFDLNFKYFLSMSLSIGTSTKSLSAIYFPLSAKANLDASPIILHVSELLYPNFERSYLSTIPKI